MHFGATSRSRKGWAISLQKLHSNSFLFSIQQNTKIVNKHLKNLTPISTFNSLSKWHDPCINTMHSGLPMRKLSYFLCLACFTVTLLCYLQTKKCFASHDHSCPQITLPHMRNTSQWSEFVTNANFVNVNEAEAIQEFVDQITELKAILNHLSELYVSYSYLSPILSSTYCK